MGAIWLDLLFSDTQQFLISFLVKYICCSIYEFSLILNTFNRIYNMCLQGVFFCIKYSHAHLNSLHMSTVQLIAFFWSLLTWHHLWYLSCSPTSVIDISLCKRFHIFHGFHKNRWTFRSFITVRTWERESSENVISSEAKFSLDSFWLESSKNASLRLSSLFDDEMFLVIFLVLLFDQNFRFLGREKSSLSSL